MLVVLYVVFSNLMRIQVEHYQLFLLLGIILWNFLDRGTSMSIWGIVGKPSLVQKVYFPRDILVISTCITALMMTALEFVVFIIFMVDLQSHAGNDHSILPDSIHIRVSDNHWVYPWPYPPSTSTSEMCSSSGGSLVQVGFFATPILYPITIFPENVRWIVMLNPMAQIITMMRDCTLYRIPPEPFDLAYVALSALVMLMIGYFIFDRLEPRFAEAI